MSRLKVGCIRVTHPCATRRHPLLDPLPFDLHVLSLPLAFILSQDQTLHCKFDLKYLRFYSSSRLLSGGYLLLNFHFKISKNFISFCLLFLKRAAKIIIFFNPPKKSYFFLIFQERFPCRNGSAKIKLFLFLQEFLK